MSTSQPHNGRSACRHWTQRSRRRSRRSVCRTLLGLMLSGVTSKEEFLSFPLCSSAMAKGSGLRLNYRPTLSSWTESALFWTAGLMRLVDFWTWHWWQGIHRIRRENSNDSNDTRYCSSWLSQKTTTPPFSIHFPVIFWISGWNPHKNGIKSLVKYILWNEPV